MYGCIISCSISFPVEDVMEEFRHNGRDFEYCPDLDNGSMPVTTPRRKKNKKPLPTECVFCRNNGEEETYYKKHLLKDVDGKVSCPVLRYFDFHCTSYLSVPRREIKEAQLHINNIHSLAILDITLTLEL